MSQNKNVVTNEAGALLLENIPVQLNIQYSKEQTCIAFGWGKCRPKCLQFLNSPRWFIVVVVVYTLCQGVAVLGLTSFVLPSIERRFRLSSKELGVIASANDISALLLVVPISFYGGYGNKIKWMGSGAVVLGFGFILFSLPHFIVGPYKPVDARTSGLCLIPNTTIKHGDPECKAPTGGEWYYMMIFVVAQLIIGAGLSPFYSLLPVYLDENVDPKSMPVYLGIWYIFTFLGPGIGSFMAGMFLSIYVDIEQPAGHNLTPRHPNWIGAWWLGFLIIGFAILLCSVIFLGFPREMPGAKQRRLKHIQQGHLLDTDGIEKPRMRDLLPELKKILTNWTFLFNALGLTAALLYVGSVTVFVAKIFRLKFGLDPVRTGYVVSLLSVTGIGFGNLFGSLVVRTFSLKNTCKKAALVCLLCNIITAFGPLSFLVPGCMNTNLAGISEPYQNGTSSGQLRSINLALQSTCNIDCHCSIKKFSPVCGSDYVTYVDPCHAGCKIKFPNMTYSNCSCIPGHGINPRSNGLAKPGYCDRKCKNEILFAILSSLILFGRFSTAVPGRTVILRCVPDNKRAFASGIQYVIFKTLGLLPGPIIFGHLVDLSCRLWQESCGKKGRCFDYDVENLSRTICFYGVAVSCLATVCYFVSWYFCKPQVETSVEAPAQIIGNPGEDSSSPAEEITQI